jgi:hypothetical protein
MHVPINVKYADSVVVCTLCFWFLFAFLLVRCLISEILGVISIFFRDGVTGEWRKLHNEELNDLYSLPNIVRVVKSRRMRWTGHVARMGGG